MGRRCRCAACAGTRVIIGPPAPSTNVTARGTRAQVDLSAEVGAIDFYHFDAMTTWVVRKDG